MAKKRVLYGISNLKEFQEKNGYFIDKTNFIESLEGYENVVFLRPRRFGKSFWCSILHHYYDLQYHKDFDFLFAGTFIHTHPTPSRGTHLVLHLNFSTVEVSEDLKAIERSFDNHCNGIINRLVHRYSRFFSTTDFINENASACSNLERLVQRLSEKDLPSLYLIIDEYDNFANQLVTTRQDRLYNDLTTGDSFFRTFFKIIKAGRESGGIANTFVTGVLPITMDDVTSAYNIATFLTLDPYFGEMLGYTQREVDGLLESIYSDYNLDRSTLPEVKNLMKNHYNGYRFIDKGESLYNPTITSYFLRNFCRDGALPEFMTDENLKTDLSWIRRLTGSQPEQTAALINELTIEREIAYNTTNLKSKFNMFQFFQPGYYPISFFYLGMLTRKPGTLRMKIPNTNILELMTGYFNEVHHIDVSTKYADMMESFGRDPNIPKLFDDYWRLYISQMPEAIFQQVNENFYRTTFFQLCSQFLSNLYTWNVERSYPSGRSDLEFVGKFHTAFAHQRHVMEFKYFSNAETKKMKPKFKLQNVQLDPEDLKQIAGYCEGLREEYPEVHAKQYVVYCFGNQGYRLFEVE